MIYLIACLAALPPIVRCKLAGRTHEIPPIKVILAATLAAFLGAFLGKRRLQKVTLRTVELTVAAMMMLIGTALATGLA